MSETPLVIAIVDDDVVDRIAAQRALTATHPGATFVLGETAADARRIASEHVDCLFLDLRLPDALGTEVIQELRARGSDLPIVVLTGHGDEQTAVAAMRSGASDYVPKAQLTPERLRQSMDRALRVRDAERQERAARAELDSYATKLRALLEASTAAHMTLTIEGAARVVADAARTILGTRIALLRVIPEGRGDEVRVLSLAPGTEPLPLAPKSSVPFAEEVAKLDGVLRLDAAALAADPVAHALAVSLGLGLPLSGWLAAPVLSRAGIAIGILHLTDKLSASTTEADEILLAQLGQLASVAIDNARLFEDERAASRARDDVLAFVSHDLRGPLSTVAMANSLIRQGVPAGSRERDHADRIHRAVDRMTRLLSDLLDVTRAEGGFFLADKVPTSTSHLIDEALDGVRVLAASNGIALSALLDPVLPRVLVDRDRILQVFANILGNALKFTPAGGTISVRTRRRADRVLVTIADTGPGIAAAHLSRLFDRYYQSGARAEQGAGLGLFIAKRVVDAHGGEIWVESVEQRGTSFFFTLPIEPALTSSAEPRPKP